MTHRPFCETVRAARAPRLLELQRHNRIQSSGLPRGIEAEEDPDAGREQDRNQHGIERNRCGHTLIDAQEFGHKKPDTYAECPSDDADDDGFNQELQEHVEAPGTDQSLHTARADALGYPQDHRRLCALCATGAESRL